jgi:hypothetical protein
LTFHEWYTKYVVSDRQNVIFVDTEFLYRLYTQSEDNIIITIESNFQVKIEGKKMQFCTFTIPLNNISKQKKIESIATYFSYVARA